MIMAILPPTPVSELNNTKDRVTALEKKQFPVSTVRKDNVNLTFVGDTGQHEEERSIDCSLMRTSSAFTLYRVHVELEQPATQLFSFDVVLNDVEIAKVYIPEGAIHVKSGLADVLVPNTKGLRLEGVIPTGVGFITVQLVGTSNAVVNQTGIFRTVTV